MYLMYALIVNIFLCPHRVSFVNNESLYFRVAKPSLWKTWVEALEMVGLHYIPVPY